MVFTQILLWLNNALESLILVRAVQGKFLKRYSIFYVYLTWVLLQSLLGFYVYVVKPALYEDFYWYANTFSVSLGYGVIWEVSRQALLRYPGAGRMARNVHAFIFIVLLSTVFVKVLRAQGWRFEGVEQLERNLRMVQASLLVALITLLAYYGIPIGRNLRGMMIGYGFFTGTSIISLTIWSYLGDESLWWWQYLQPIAYLLVLLIWCSALWSYEPNPTPTDEPEIERDCELLAAATRRRLLQVRAYLGRAVRW